MRRFILIAVVLCLFLPVADAGEPKSPVFYAGWIELDGYEQYLMVKSFKAGYETALMMVVKCLSDQIN